MRKNTDAALDKELAEIAEGRGRHANTQPSARQLSAGALIAAELAAAHNSGMTEPGLRGRARDLAGKAAAFNRRVIPPAATRGPRRKAA